MHIHQAIAIIKIHNKYIRHFILQKNSCCSENFRSKQIVKNSMKYNEERTSAISTPRAFMTDEKIPRLLSSEQIHVYGTHPF